MIRLDKSKLCIAVLTLILSVLLLQTAAEKTGQKQIVFSELEEPLRFKELIAPVRHIRQPAEGEKICYLTFDDGPSENTEKVLDILAEHDAKATFFVIGESLDENAAPLLQRMSEEGHAIGMHANVHSYEKLYADMDSFLEDYENLYTTLKEDYGIDTALFRFPGEVPAAVCTDTGMNLSWKWKREDFPALTGRRRERIPSGSRPLLRFRKMSLRRG